MEKRGVIHFENAVQKALWDFELSGQISDGFWENASPHGHWKVWCLAKTVVDGTFGTDIQFADKRNYNFRNPELLEVVGERMLTMARMVLNGFTDCQLYDKLYVNELDEEGYRSLMNRLNSSDKYWVEKSAKVQALFPTWETLKAAQTRDDFTMTDLKKELAKISLAIRTVI